MVRQIFIDFIDDEGYSLRRHHIYRIFSFEREDADKRIMSYLDDDDYVPEDAVNALGKRQCNAGWRGLHN